MGTPRGFQALREAMGGEMLKTALVPSCEARDQGHLNYLHFAGRLQALLPGAGRVVVQPRGEGIVNTVGYIMPRDSITQYLTASGQRVANDDGSVSAVVHQYDRFPLLRRLFAARRR